MNFKTKQNTKPKLKTRKKRSQSHKTHIHTHNSHITHTNTHTHTYIKRIIFQCLFGVSFILSPVTNAIVSNYVSKREQGTALGVLHACKGITAAFRFFLFCFFFWFLYFFFAKNSMLCFFLANNA